MGRVLFPYRYVVGRAVLEGWFGVNGVEWECCMSIAMIRILWRRAKQSSVMVNIKGETWASCTVCFADGILEQNVSFGGEVQ